MIPNDTYFIVTPASSVELIPGAYAPLGGTDLFFYVTETGTLQAVNMNSSGSEAAPGAISYALAQGAKWCGAAAQGGVVHVYYADVAGGVFYAPYASLGQPPAFQQLGEVASAVTFSVLYTATSTPHAFLLMIDDGVRHNLYAATDAAFTDVVSTTVTFNNTLNTLALVSRPSIAMHPSDTNNITVTCERTNLMSQATSVGFYEVEVPGLT